MKAQTTQPAHTLWAFRGHQFASRTRGFLTDPPLWCLYRNNRLPLACCGSVGGRAKEIAGGHSTMNGFLSPEAREKSICLNHTHQLMRQYTHKRETAFDKKWLPPREFAIILIIHTPVIPSLRRTLYAFLCKCVGVLLINFQWVYSEVTSLCHTLMSM